MFGEAGIESGQRSACPKRVAGLGCRRVACAGSAAPRVATGTKPDVGGDKYVLTIAPKISDTINSIAGLEKRARSMAAVEITPTIASAGGRSITLLRRTMAACAPTARSTHHGVLRLINEAISLTATAVLGPLPDTSSSRQSTPAGRDARATNVERGRACAGRRRRQLRASRRRANGRRS